MAVSADICMVISVATQTLTTIQPPPQQQCLQQLPVLAHPPDSTTAKWVLNLSSKPFMEAQNLLLAWGPKFAMVPRYSPKLPPRQQWNSGTESSQLLRRDCSLRTNITREEARAFKEFWED